LIQRFSLAGSSSPALHWQNMAVYSEKLAARERKEHKARRADTEWRMASDFPLK